MSLRQPRRWVTGLIASACLILPLTLTVSPAQANLVQKAGNGKGGVDWTAGVITVTGSGAAPDRGGAAQRRLMANRAAVADGYRQLAEIVNGVHVDSETVVKDMVTESDVIRTKVSALIKGARPGTPRYLSDGAVEVDVTMSLYGQAGLSAVTTPVTALCGDDSETDSALPQGIGGLLQLVVASYLPQGLSEVMHLAAAKPPAKKSLSRKQPPKKTVVPPAPVASHFTGVIINCQGLGAQPAMSPTIMDTSGGEIYLGRRDMPESFADFVINEGIVSYVNTMQEATANERAGKNPLVLKASNVSGGFKADAVLSNALAQQLVGAEADAKVMSNAKVVFVL